MNEHISSLSNTVSSRPKLNVMMMRHLSTVNIYLGILCITKEQMNEASMIMMTVAIFNTLVCND